MPGEDSPGRKFLGMHRGTVADNVDPQRLGRCRIWVRGVTPEEGGAWAHPIGTTGGGAPGRGMYPEPPPVGADVCVWFEQGDIDHPYFMGGNYGRDDRPPQVSDEENTDEEALKVAVWETERWRVKLDGRNGKAEAHIIDKVTGDVVELDGVSAGVRIKATGKVQIESSSEVAIISRGAISIGGRTVVKNGKPIGQLMAVDNSTFCTVIDAFVPPLCIPLPGGGEICLQTGPGTIPVSADVCKDLLGQLNVAIAGLAPIMCLIDVALALINVVKAIPDSIGPPPDPTALASALADLVEKAACLIPLVPQLSICPLIKALLDLIIACIGDIIQQLENLVVIRVGAADARQQIDILSATNTVGLDLSDAIEALDCEEQNLNLLEAALAGGTESIQRLLDVTVNPLMGLAGLDPIELDEIDFNAPGVDEIIDSLELARKGLLTIRDALPC